MAPPADPMSESRDPVSQCLIDLERGDRSAVDRLLPHIYEDLRALARGIFRGGANHTLQPTAIVHEAYMRLVKSEGDRGWTGRRHFLDVAAMAMRQLLANHAAARRRLKRGGAQSRVELHSGVAEAGQPQRAIDVVDFDDALSELARLDPRQARVVELRFLSGLTVDETAKVLGVSPRTVHTDWQMARSWLGLRLGA